MKQAVSFGLAILILGIVLGVAGIRVAMDRFDLWRPATATIARQALHPSTKTVPILEQRLSFVVRSTDALIRLAGSDKDKVVGIRVYDSYTGDGQTTPGVDVIWERQAELFDQPDATDLEAYRHPSVEGLSIQQTKDLTIDGRPAIKQLYTATLKVPGPLGSTTQKSLPNQLRYVIADGERFLIVRTAAERQTFLDAIATSLTFGTSDTGGLSLDTQSSGSASLPTQDSQTNATIQLGSPDPISPLPLTIQE